jgi:hypothetical protein
MRALLLPVSILSHKVESYFKLNHKRLLILPVLSEGDEG